MKITRRIVSILLVCCFVLILMPTVLPQANAYAAAKPLPTLTGDKGQDAAKIALSQLGYSESNGCTVYGAWWNTQNPNGYDFTNKGWCAIFANWCAYQAGAGMNVAYNKGCAVVGNSFSYISSQGYSDTTFSGTPQPGDFIYFGYNAGAKDHVAIVVGYNQATNMLTFVGGNQSNKVSAYELAYSSKARYGSQRITGIARPNYGGAPADVCTCTDTYAGCYTVTTTTSYLNIRGGHSTNFGIVASIPPGARVSVTKADGKWAHVEYNGTTGYASMDYLRRAVEHPWEKTYTVDVEPTATTPGSKSMHCSNPVCDARLNVTEIPALGGSASDPEPTPQPTPTPTPDPEPAKKSGLVKEKGELYYYRDGVLDTAFRGIVKHTDGDWYYIQDGTVNYFYKGLADNVNGRWFVRDGKVDYTYTGIADCQYVKGGKVSTTFTGLYCDGRLYWYIEKGQINFDYTGTLTQDGVTYTVSGGLAKAQ